MVSDAQLHQETGTHCTSRGLSWPLQGPTELQLGTSLLGLLHGTGLTPARTHWILTGTHWNPGGPSCHPNWSRIVKNARGSTFPQRVMDLWVRSTKAVELMVRYKIKFDICTNTMSVTFHLLIFRAQISDLRQIIFCAFSFAERPP